MKLTLLFAQADAESDFFLEEDFGPLPESVPDFWYSYVYYSSVSWGLFLLGGAFWLWMLISCIRNDPERNLWLWILILVNPGFPLGAVLYFFIRWLPHQRLTAPKFLRRWVRSGELQRLEAAAHQIGNPHQHVLFGDALREIGSYAEAGTAYEKALAKDPQNLPALWGAGLVALKTKKFAAARDHFRKILDADPGYKFGDVSLAYGRALVALRETEAAREHLEKHVKRWKQPEAQYLLASLLAEQGQPAEARRHLESLLLDMRGAPRFFIRQNRIWASKGKRLLRKLPRS